MLIWAVPALTWKLRREHWARVLERWAPERCTVATAAAILGIDARRLAGAVAPAGEGREITAATLLSRQELVSALRGSARQPHP